MGSGCGLWGAMQELPLICGGCLPHRLVGDELRDSSLWRHSRPCSARPTSPSVQAPMIVDCNIL